MKRFATISMIVFAGLICCFSISGCYYDSEEDLYGTNCDTTNVTYSITIKGLLNNNTCLTCHFGPNPSGGINLETYPGVKAKVDDGALWGAINHIQGFHPMPDGGGKMNQCDINKVKAWIDRGAPNN